MRKIKVAQRGVQHDHANVIYRSITHLSDIFDVLGIAVEPEEDSRPNPVVKEGINGSLYSGAWNKASECCGKEIKEVELEEISPYYTEVENFINSVRNNRIDGICSGADALLTTRHCAALRTLLGED